MHLFQYQVLEKHNIVVAISKASHSMSNHQLLYPIEFLNSLKFLSLLDHALHSKVVAIIMLLRNLNQNSGICNGTRLIITQLDPNIIEGNIISNIETNTRFFIPRIVLTTKHHKCPFVFTRKQFPIRVCYGRTINKSHGQTLDKIGLHLPQSFFTHGQLYVALSRVTSQSGLKILVTNKDGSATAKTKNIVYKKILRIQIQVWHNIFVQLHNNIYFYFIYISYIYINVS